MLRQPVELWFYKHRSKEHKIQEANTFFQVSNKTSESLQIYNNWEEETYL